VKCAKEGRTSIIICERKGMNLGEKSSD